MTTKTIARCAIYDSRPEVCRVYPKVDQYRPPECTFSFSGAERQGDCSCDTGACCAIPRQDGEPGGVALPESAGGQSCKHLVWEEIEEPIEKSAEESSDIADDTRTSIQGLLDVVNGD